MFQLSHFTERYVFHRPGRLSHFTERPIAFHRAPTRISPSALSHFTERYAAGNVALYRLFSMVYGERAERPNPLLILTNQIFNPVLPCGFRQKDHAATLHRGLPPLRGYRLKFARLTAGKTERRPTGWRNHFLTIDGLCSPRLKCNAKPKNKNRGTQPAARSDFDCINKTPGSREGERAFHRDVMQELRELQQGRQLEELPHDATGH